MEVNKTKGVQNVLHNSNVCFSQFLSTSKQCLRYKHHLQKLSFRYSLIIYSSRIFKGGRKDYYSYKLPVEVFTQEINVVTFKHADWHQIFFSSSLSGTMHSSKTQNIKN